MIGVSREIDVDHFAHFEIGRSDEFDYVGEEVRDVAALGHVGQEPFHALE